MEWLNLAQVQLRLGDTAAARAAVRTTLPEAVDVGGSFALTLSVLMVADLLVSEGRPAEGVALLGLVKSLPTAGRWELQEIDRFLARLRSNPRGSTERCWPMPNWTSTV